MSPIKSRIARRAVKTTARHTAHGTASKIKREPLRAGFLLGIGAVVGVIAGRLLLRPAPPAPSPQS